MRTRRFGWEGAFETALAARTWMLAELPEADVEEIGERVVQEGDAAVLELTARFDATEIEPSSLRVPPTAAADALAALDPSVKESLELAAANVRAVAEAQVDSAPREVTLPQGQSVTIREATVYAAGVYAPGGRAAYPSSVLMCAIPARVAGVEHVALASPPAPDGQVSPLVLAAAELCGVDEIYAMGGAQAIFALAYGTESVNPVNAIVGPGNAWVREAKRAVSGVVAIDSLAGPSELMVVAGHDANLEWIALDLCAQAEHGPESPLLITAVEDAVLDGIVEATERAAAQRPGVADALLGVVKSPDLDRAIELANEFAPEHLELLADDAALLAAKVTTAGCVFAGHHSATAFGDYVAGSNHVLPTAGAGRYSGPLGPDAFRRKIATVEVPPGAASKLAPYVDALARAEGFPVHGESAMIRSEP
jgi:histidinol dehydrogenase